MQELHGTTVIAVKRYGKTAIAGDGQVTLANTIMKSKARKVRKIYNDRILVGFAGATADAFTLFERFEGKIQEFHGDLLRAAVELAKDWRTDKVLRRLEAMLLAADKKNIHVLHMHDTLCRYKNIFGLPGKGIHAYRVCGFAAADVFLTIIAAVIIHYMTGYTTLFCLITLLIISIIMHRAFCVRTTLDVMLFPT